MKKNRFIRSLAVAGFALLMLSGCTDVSMDTVLDEDGSGSMTSSVVIDRVALEAVGGSGDAFLEQVVDGVEADEGTVIERIDTDEEVGFTAVTSGNWKEDADFGGETFSVIHEDGTLLFELPFERFSQGIDLTSVSTVLNSFDVSVTFPGEVESVSYNGVIDGKTVTWGLDSVLAAAEDGGTLTATGADSDFNLWFWVGVAGGVVAVLLVLLAVVLVIIRSRKSKTPPAATTASNPPPTVTSLSTAPESSFSFAAADSTQSSNDSSTNYNIVKRPESTIPGAYNLPTQARRNGNRFQ